MHGYTRALPQQIHEGLCALLCWNTGTVNVTVPAYIF
jgi:hypothetical protein